MAAKTGSSFSWNGEDSDIDNEEEEKRNKTVYSVCMERLRHKITLQKTWTDSINALRIAVVEKRTQNESTDKNQLQTCMDTLQQSLKVVTQQSMIDRLESIARCMGLKFTIPTGNEPQVVIGSDMFRVEVLMEKSGIIKEVKIAHQGEPASCQDLVDLLSQQCFREFSQHLNGLNQLYSVPGDKKQKTKAFLALQSLETDLNELAQLQNSINGVANYIHKSPLGILMPRIGGQAMKLIYFVSPYDLLDRDSKSAHDMTVEAITDHSLGHYVTVCVESGQNTRLQTMPLMTVTKSDGKGLPHFPDLNNNNSCILPATFCLVLPVAMPIAFSVVNKIQEITGMKLANSDDAQSLLSLILVSSSQGKLSKERKLHVTLPDQQHLYYINNFESDTFIQPGLMVSKIPFTHPTSVGKILNLLRQQLLFNTILNSCIRPSACRDCDKSLVFELSSQSLSLLSVAFEHPAEDSMVTVEFDLTDITSLKCKIFSTNTDDISCSDDYISKVFQRCFSIPVTLRSVSLKLQCQLKKHELAIKAAIDAMKNKSTSHNCLFLQRHPGLRLDIPTKPVVPPPNYSNQNSYSPVSSEGVQPSPHASNLSTPTAQFPGTNLQNEATKTPLLAHLLDEASGMVDPSSVSDSPMLSKLLEDQTSVATAIPILPNAKSKKPRKRYCSSETGLSPKRHASESSDTSQILDSKSGILSVDRTPDLDSSASSLDSSVHSGMSVAHSSGSCGSVIDLTDQEAYLQSDSHVKKLEDTLKNIIHDSQPPMVDMGAVTPDLKSSIERGREAPDAKQLQTLLQNLPKNDSASLEGVLAGSGEANEQKDPTIKLSPIYSYPSGQWSKKDPSGVKKSSIVEIILNNKHPEEADISKPLPLPVPTSKTSSTATNKIYTSVKEERSGSPIVRSGGKPAFLTEPNSPYMDREMKSKSEEGIVMKLQLSSGGVRHIENKSSLSPSHSLDVSSNSNKHRPSSTSDAFDFISDDDDQSVSFPVRDGVGTSPSRQFFKQQSKNCELTNKTSKEKKKKESRHESSSESGKRKRDKEESKKERKRKKAESEYIQEAVYRSTTVETTSGSDTKSMPKLKITKSGVRVSLETSSPRSSPVASSPKESSIEGRKHSSNIEKIAVKTSSTNKQTNNKMEKSPTKVLSHKSSHHKLSKKNSSVVVSQNNSYSKSSDSKLTKTPTIKLKPLVIPASSNSVHVSSSNKITSSPSTTSVKSSVVSPSITKTPITSPSTNTSKTLSSPSVTATKALTLPSVNQSKTSASPSLSQSKTLSSPVNSNKNLSSSLTVSSSKNSSSSPSTNSKGLSPVINPVKSASSSSGLIKSTSTSPVQSKTASTSKSSISSASKTTSSNKSLVGSSLPRSATTASQANAILSSTLASALGKKKNISSLPPIPKLSTSNSKTPTSVPTGGSSSSSATSIGAGNTAVQSASSKNLARSRKGSLSAVIDKLTKSTTPNTSDISPENLNRHSKVTDDKVSSQSPQDCKNITLGSHSSHELKDSAKTMQNARHHSKEDRCNANSVAKEFKQSKNNIDMKQRSMLTNNKDFIHKAGREGADKGENRMKDQTSKTGSPATSQQYSSPAISSAGNFRSSSPASHMVTKTSSPSMGHSASSSPNKTTSSPRQRDVSGRSSHSPVVSSHQPLLYPGKEITDPRLAALSKAAASANERNLFDEFMAKDCPQKRESSDKRPLSDIGASVVDKKEKVRKSAKDSSKFTEDAGLDTNINVTSQCQQSGSGDVGSSPSSKNACDLGDQRQQPETKLIENRASMKRKLVRQQSQVHSPVSDCSSPEDGLIIDCPVSPPSPIDACEFSSNKMPRLSDPTNCVNAKSDINETDEQAFIKTKPSPLTPSGKERLSSSTSPISPQCAVDDDDLMDEALMGIGS